MKWDESYRKIFFDYHNFAKNHSIAKYFDAKEFASNLDEIGCEMVSVFALCGKGQRYYRKGKYGQVHPMLPEGVDIVESVIKECHERNIKILAYVSYGISNELLKKYPEFAERGIDGTPTINDWSGMRACKIGYACDYLLKQYKELCENYTFEYFFVDGSYSNDICYCDYCRKTFEEDTGYQLPTVREGVVWKTYLDWHHRQMERHRKNIRDTVHGVNKDIQVMINWAYSYRRPDILTDDLDILFADVPFKDEMEGIDMTTRAFALTGKKFEIHNTSSLHPWRGCGLKSPIALKRAAALLLANGTNVHTGYLIKPNFKIEKAVFDAYKELFDWVKIREKYLRNNEIKPYIGAFMANFHHGITHTNNMASDPKWLYGFNRLMLNSGLHYNMLTAEFMKDKINSFSAVFLPDMRYITDEDVLILDKYVKEGGTLIVTGLAGAYDKLGNYTNRTNSKLEEILGIKWFGLYEESHSYMKIEDPILAKNTSDMPLFMEAETALVKTNGAKKLASLYDLYKNNDGKYPLDYAPPQSDTGYSAVTLNEYGKGKAVYFATDIGMSYYRSYQWNLPLIVKNLLFDICGIEQRVSVTNDGTCEVTLAKRGEITQVHIVNMVGTMPISTLQEYRASITIDQVIERTDIEVNVLHHKKATKVIMRPQNKELPFETDGNKVKFVIPKLGLYEIIEIF